MHMIWMLMFRVCWISSNAQEKEGIFLSHACTIIAAFSHKLHF